MTLIAPHVLASFRERVPAKRFVSLLAVLHFFAVLALADDYATKPNPKAEQYVRAQVERGEPANLENQQFPHPADRGLGPNFLYDLLTKWTIKNADLPRDGVMIWHAQFPEGVNLENADVPIDV